MTGKKRSNSKLSTLYLIHNFVLHSRLSSTSFTSSGVMVRLMLVLAPVMCVLSGIAVSATLTTYMKNLDSTGAAAAKAASLTADANKPKKKADHTYPMKNEVATAVVGIMTLFLCM